MPKPRKKKYEAGDQVHFIITDDFVDTANRFYDHCDENMLNASQVFRRAVSDWLDRAIGGGGADAPGDIPAFPYSEDGLAPAGKGGTKAGNGHGGPGGMSFGLGRESMRPASVPERMPDSPIIEQAFVIYKDGALLAHATNRVIPDLDMDLFSSMLTLIQGFVTESFSDVQDTGISLIEFGERNVLIESQPKIGLMLAMVYTGHGNREDIESIAHAILFEMEFTFGYVLKNFDGNLLKVRGMREIIVSHISSAL